MELGKRGNAMIKTIEQCCKMENESMQKEGRLKIKWNLWKICKSWKNERDEKEMDLVNKSSKTRTRISNKF
jgi:hypothetical protein